MYRLLCAVLIAVLAACSNVHKQEDLVAGAGSNERIGWLHGNCLAIKNPDITNQNALTLILLDEPQSIIKGKIIGKATTGEQCYPLLEDRRQINVDSGYSFYLIDTEKPVNLAIGVLGDDNSVSTYQFDYCTTSEGVLFSANKNGVEVWNGYYYLGYDSEATCKPTN